ncbi:PTS sugar transporter subunit IIA [Aerococcus sp. 1KP-2016]|uniref:PTS sugar transporter subunit IIA n=1 Tax=Aerococcus sp. 1KP-2016 TaxID=1981982 RepID=UPI000B98B747|nr:PTS sugar transporter subunit IIA [Aerococcus sp. 1KP-2016]OYQ67955.1 PTS fructose transporter subunit IIA [Aerococcus sp. 1KP-2016]
MVEYEVIHFNVSGLKSDLDVLSFLSDDLFEKGIVKKSFKKAIQDREKEFATGLLVNGIGFAIPHTDIEHVNESQIAILTLKNSVEFYQMGDNTTKVPVRIVFMLALKEAKSHLEMLQKLVELMQNNESIDQILSLEDSEKSKQEMIKILKTNNVI